MLHRVSKYANCSNKWPLLMLKSRSRTQKLNGCASLLKRVLMKCEQMLHSKRSHWKPVRRLYSSSVRSYAGLRTLAGVHVYSLVWLQELSVLQDENMSLKGEASQAQDDHTAVQQKLAEALSTIAVHEEKGSTQANEIGSLTSQV